MCRARLYRETLDNRENAGLGTVREVIKKSVKIQPRGRI